jgi:methylenetetrahydrofolate reductase (NADPH)
MTSETAMARPRATSAEQARAEQAHVHRAARLIGAASVEISPRDDPVRDGLVELLAPGTTVFVNHPGSVTHHDIVAACVRLRHAGLDPVPHVAARRLASFTQARDFVQRAAGEAEVTGVLLIGGDPAQAMGPFRDSAELLATGLIDSHAIRHVAFAGYPEGHPSVDRRSLDARLRAKLALAREHGLETSLVTQFVFEPDPVERWMSALRADGISCPIRIGVAGPATIATLAKFAVRCGIGASLRALGRGQTAFARILAEATPDTLIGSLIAGEERWVPIDGLHIFTFGGVRRTAEWIAARSGRSSA